MSIYGPEHESYLAALKPGAYVLVGARRAPRVEKVFKVTATQIVTARESNGLEEKLSETRYNKQTGAERSTSRGYYYGRDYILPDVPSVTQTAEFERVQASNRDWREKMLDVIKHETALAEHIALKLGISIDRVHVLHVSQDRMDKTQDYKITIDRMTQAEIGGKV